MASVDLSLEELEVQRDIVIRQMNDIQKSWSFLSKLKNGLDTNIKALKSKQLPEHIFTINTRPSKIGYIEHTIGFFTEVNNAKRLIPKESCSTDIDTGVNWQYSVIVYDGDRKFIDPEKLDPKFLPDFPY